MPVLDLFFIATAMGFLGSIHCIGMCGPIVLGVFKSLKNTNPLQYFVYHLGKIMAYASIGILFGLIGKSAHLFLSQQRLSIVTGSMMLAYFIFQKLNKKFHLFSPPRFADNIYAAIKRAANKIPLPKYYTLGLLNGYLPCGLSYLAAMSSVSTGHISKSVLWMVFFGLSTIPSLSFVLWISSMTENKFRNVFQFIYEYMILIIAILLILRGLDLGIPYLSPHFDQDENLVSKCCHG
jgi:sulfite exporter TauE/SafE